MGAKHLSAGYLWWYVRAAKIQFVMVICLAAGLSISPALCQQPAGQPAPQPAQAGAAQPAAQPAAAQAGAQPATPAAEQAAPVPQQPPPGAGQPAAAEPQAPPLPVEYTQLSDFGGQDEKTWLKKRLDVQSILRGGSLTPDQQATVQEYYEKFALARWTVKEKFSELASFREELRRDFWNVKGTPAHGFLQQVALNFLSKVATNADGTYHPAARYNALLAIAELNAAEAPSASQPPTPLPQAVPMLADALEDAGGIDALKAAALIGLRRHAALGIQDQQIVTDRLLPALLQIATTKAPPSGRSPEGHLWMRARAIEVLGLLRLPGDQRQVLDALVAIAGEEGAPLLPRCAAARAVGMIDYSQASGVSAAQMAAALGQLAVDVCSEELSLIDKEIEAQKSRPTTGMMYNPYASEYSEESSEAAYEAAYQQMYGGGAAPGTRTAKKEEEDKAPNNRRRLKAGLNAVFVGVTGMDHHLWLGAGKPMDGIAAAAANPADQQLVQSLLDQVLNIVKLCDAKQPDKQVFRDTIQAETAKLREVLAQIGGVATAPQQAASGS